jgi:hypothetical protein
MNECSSIKKDLIKVDIKPIIIKEKPSINSDKVNIIGSVFNAKTGNPINYAIVTFGCYNIQVSSQGEYSIKN